MIGLDRQVLPVAVGLDRKNYLGAILREGVVDLQSVIAALMEMEYSAFLSIEYEGAGDPGGLAVLLNRRFNRCPRLLKIFRDHGRCHLDTSIEGQKPGFRYLRKL